MKIFSDKVAIVTGAAQGMGRAIAEALAQAVLGIMKSNRFGRIVNMSSSAGRSVSTLGGAHYTTAKAAVLGFTRAVAKEMAPYDITVNAVCPGLIDTDMVRLTVSPEKIAAYEAGFPVPRLGTPAEVANLVLFLISGAPYITGASIDINGGDLMM
ncbi:MAG: SDR family oxidoreductase [Deltaproteobacteria bacterium]|nr:SDR family oxidoreductase [Deltaproteobacteria bacterium]